MKILLFAVGTRGDMEPFLTIGTMLQKQGHEVHAGFPEQFAVLTKEASLPFHSLGPEFLQLLDSEDGLLAMGGKPGLTKILAMIRLAKKGQYAQKVLMKRQQEIVALVEPDRIIHHNKAIYPLIWEVNQPGRTVMVSPVPYLHYIKDHSHLAFNSDFGPLLNKLTYKFAEWGLLSFATKALKQLKNSIIKKADIKGVLRTQKVIYTISPQLFSRPIDWHPRLQVLGYHERNKKINWTPNSDLNDFIKKHKKILLITFGSMGNLNPKKNTQLLIELVTKHNIPTIVNTAAGGLVEPKKYNSGLIHFVANIPYDWVFPKVHAVIHHGGSGTTYTSLKYGCATMIIPHIIDQFVWNKLVAEKQCGPKGVPISKLSKRAIEGKLLDLFMNDTYRQNAEKVGNKMRSEDYQEKLIQELLE